MDKEQLIQSYIANKLSQKDKEIVEKRLQTDPDFKELFESHNDVAVAYKISEAQSLKERLQKIEYKKQTSKFRIPKVWYSAIAAILIIGFFYITNNKTTGEDLFNSNFTIYPNTYQPITRDHNEGKNVEAFNAYENKDFKNAESKFQEILKTSNDPNLQFYYAMTLMNTSKLDIALEQLNLIKIDDYDYKEEALWYTALIYLKKEDFEKAKIQLETLDRLNATFKSKERKLILEKIKS